MKNLRARAGLTTFVKRECANYVNESCVYFKDYCHVINGKKGCSYFEKCVLGPVDYEYRTIGYDWQKLFAEYGQINKRFAGRGVLVRRCECGNVLEYRERVCQKCRDKKRRESYRKYREPKSLVRHS